MKTPIQQLIDKIREYRDEETSPIAKSRLNSVLVDAIGMLEQEKIVIRDFAARAAAFNCKGYKELKNLYELTF